MAVTDRRIGSSKASVEHPTDRIRNAAGEKTGVTSGQGDVGDCRQAESSDLGCGYFHSPDVGGRMKSNA